jgi:hypothetical protein
MASQFQRSGVHLESPKGDIVIWHKRTILMEQTGHALLRAGLLNGIGRIEGPY